MRKVVIIGGGIAGLITAIQLCNAGVPCVVIEKKAYPFHRVCGEYISNEAVDFLKRIKAYPDQFSPSQINQFQLSSISGRSATLPLDLGGFGISRFNFDNFLYTVAKNAGAEFLLDTEISEVNFSQNTFLLTTDKLTFEADCVVGAFGKRSKLDVQLKRKFISKRSPYVGVKYHVRTDHPANLVALHNFDGGYCGVAAIEDSKTNLCYLTHRDNVRENGDIRTMEQRVLYKNPVLRSIFENSEFLFSKPEVINEISYELKTPLENHMLMVGDAAGMIAPLCGNGMAIAIHSAKIASELINNFYHQRITREQLEHQYTSMWTKNFARRLWVGRNVQRLFGSAILSSVSTNILMRVKPVAGYIIRNTHGKSF